MRSKKIILMYRPPPFPFDSLFLPQECHLKMEVSVSFVFLFTIQGMYYVKMGEGGGQPKVAGFMSGPLRAKRTVWEHAQPRNNECCYVFSNS